jgi:hypothetical protein
LILQKTHSHAKLAPDIGTLYSPNITADSETGIGDWSDADFIRAVHKGVAKPELNSKRRNGPCNALILLIWGSDFSKTWCHVCMLFRLVHG